MKKVIAWEVNGEVFTDLTDAISAELLEDPETRRLLTTFAEMVEATGVEILNALVKYKPSVLRMYEILERKIIDAEAL